MITESKLIEAGFEKTTQKGMTWYQLPLDTSGENFIQCSLDGDGLIMTIEDTKEIRLKVCSNVQFDMHIKTIINFYNLIDEII